MLNGSIKLCINFNYYLILISVILESCLLYANVNSVLLPNRIHWLFYVMINVSDKTFCTNINDKRKMFSSRVEQRKRKV